MTTTYIVVFIAALYVVPLSLLCWPWLKQLAQRTAAVGIRTLRRASSTLPFDSVSKDGRVQWDVALLTFLGCRPVGPWPEDPDGPVTPRSVSNSGGSGSSTGGTVIRLGDRMTAASDDAA